MKLFAKEEDEVSLPLSRFMRHTKLEGGEERERELVCLIAESAEGGQSYAKSVAYLAASFKQQFLHIKLSVNWAPSKLFGQNALGSYIKQIWWLTKNKKYNKKNRQSKGRARGEGGAKKQSERRRHKENKLDDNGLPKTIETADGVNCRVGPESERERERRRGSSANARGVCATNQIYNLCVCVWVAMTTMEMKMATIKNAAIVSAKLKWNFKMKRISSMYVSALAQRTRQRTLTSPPPPPSSHKSSGMIIKTIPNSYFFSKSPNEFRFELIELIEFSSWYFMRISRVVFYVAHLLYTKVTLMYY